MGKLVRDKIPDIIRRSGRTPHVTTLDHESYRPALLAKLLEEAAEIGAAQTRDEVIDEAADVLEVISALAAAHDSSLEAVAEAARKKRAERGGFAMRVWLEHIEPEAQTP